MPAMMHQISALTKVSTPAACQGGLSVRLYSISLISPFEKTQHWQQVIDHRFISSLNYRDWMN